MGVLWDVLLVVGVGVGLVVAYVGQRFLSMYLYYQRTKPLYADMEPVRGAGKMPFLYFFDNRLGKGLAAMDRRDEEGTLLTPPRILHVGTYMDGSHLVALSDAEAIKQLLVEENFPKHPLGYGVLDVMLGNGLVTSTGDLWFHQRKLITPSFHFSHLKQMHAAMVVEGEKMVAHLKSQPTSPSDLGGRAPVYAGDFFASVAMAVIVNTSFGGLLDPKKVAGHWYALVKALNAYSLTRVALGKTFNDFLPLPANRAVNREATTLRVLVREAIAKKREELAAAEATGDTVTAKDLLTSLLLARDGEGNGMDENLIVDECLTFLFAGQDTTSNVLSWVMYMLAQRPEEQQKLQEEVDRVLGGRTPTFEDLKELKYCKCVEMETIRMHGPNPVLQRYCPVQRTVTLSDGSSVTIPGNTALWLMFRKTMSDPRFWGPDSEEFRPSRFDKSRIHEEPPRHPYSFIAFSAGQRNCIGQKFALNQGVVLLAMLMQNFTVHADPDQDVKMVFEGTVTPEGFYCSFSPR